MSQRKWAGIQAPENMSTCSTSEQRTALNQNLLFSQQDYSSTDAEKLLLLEQAKPKSLGFSQTTQRSLVRSLQKNNKRENSPLIFIKRSLTSNARQSYFLLPSPFESRTSKQWYLKLYYPLHYNQAELLHCQATSSHPSATKHRPHTHLYSIICYRTGFRAATLHLHHFDHLYTSTGVF